MMLLEGQAPTTRAAAPDGLMRAAYSLTANSLLTAVLGVAFWIVAARLYPPEQMGRDSVLITAMVTLSAICQLNLPNALLRFLPTVRRRRARLVARAYAVSGAVALALATAFVVAAPAVSDRFAFLRSEPGIAAAYVAAVGVWAVFALQDAALTALRRTSWLPVENGAFGLLKLAGLPVLLALGCGDGVFVAWIVPLLVLVPAVNVLLFRRVLPAQPPAVASPPAAGRRLAPFLLQDYAANVFWQAAMTAVPILVLALLGPQETAYFYVPFTLVVAFDLLFLNVTSALVVEGAHDEHRIAALTRRLAARFAAPVIGGALVLVVAAPLVLAPFGAEYADHGATVLRLLAAASLLRAVTTLHSAVARLRGRGAQILAVASAFCALSTALIVALAPPLGVEGVAWAWLAASAVTAAGVTPWLLRTLRVDAPAASIAAGEGRP